MRPIIRTLLIIIIILLILMRFGKVGNTYAGEKPLTFDRIAEILEKEGGYEL